MLQCISPCASNAGRRREPNCKREQVNHCTFQKRTFKRRRAHLLLGRLPVLQPSLAALTVALVAPRLAPMAEQPRFRLEAVQLLLLARVGPWLFAKLSTLGRRGVAPN